MAEQAATVEPKAWELHPGDFLRLGFSAPEGLRDTNLQVTGIHGVVLGEGIPVRRVVELDSGTVLGFERFLWREADDRFAVARQVTREEVSGLFGPKRAEQLYSGARDGGDAGPQGIRRRKVLDGFGGWTGPCYWPDMEIQGWRLGADPDREDLRQAVETLRMSGETRRNRRPQAVSFGFRRLLSGDGARALEVYLHEGGRTEMCVVSFLHPRHIEEIVRREPVAAPKSENPGPHGNIHAGQRSSASTYSRPPVMDRGRFTLMEVLLALGIVGLIVGGGILLYSAAKERHEARLIERERERAGQIALPPPPSIKSSPLHLVPSGD